MSNNRHELSVEQKADLETSIIDFLSWLRKIKKLKAEAAKKYNNMLFTEPTQEDWIMKADDSTISFNTCIISKCSFRYYKMVILHECFHLFVQDLPNKVDAKRLKDDFGEEFMKLLDIEADYYTAMYFREVKRTSLVDIFQLNYEGSRIFGDRKIRWPKLERFIGATLSIANAYFRSTGWETYKDNELYLPTIKNITTEESIHVLVHKKNHFMLSEIIADIRDFDPDRILKALYKMRDNRLAA
jgi:hypothetical protein